MKFVKWRPLVKIGSLIMRSGAPQLRLRLAGAMMLFVLGPISTVWSPVVLGDAINYLVSAEDNTVLDPRFVVGTVISFALAAFSSLTPEIRALIFTRVSEAAMARASAEALQHLLTLSIDFHHTRQSGSLTRIVDRGVRSIDVLIERVIFGIGPTIIEVVLAFGVMVVRLDWRFALTAFIGVVVFMVFTLHLNQKQLAYRRQLNEADYHVGGLLTDALIGLETVKTFGAEERIVSSYRNAADNYAEASLKAANSRILLRVTEHGLVRVCMAVIVIMVGIAVTEGRMQVGEVFIAVFLLRGLFFPLEVLGEDYRDIRQAFTDMEKMVELMVEEPSIRDKLGVGDLPSGDAHGFSVSFDHVCYQHDARSKGGLRGVSFTIPPKSTFALVGPSGSGKSTIVRLLTRLIDPHSGSVKVDGINLQEVRQSSIRKTIAVVPQDVILFNDTLHVNLTFGNPDAQLEEVWKIVDAAGLRTFIDSLELGMSTLVGERGLKLSGGERQRIGLARALLTKPKVLILDEATSALDGPTETVIHSTLRKARAKRTTLIIAHRLSTIVDADQILVMLNGQIIERGTHAELLPRNGVYTKLWQHQTREN